MFSRVTGASLTEIFKEIDRLRTEAPPAGELDGIKNNLAGIFTVVNSSRSGLINQLQFVDLHGLGDEYVTNYVKNLLAVTPEDVRATAEKHLDPQKISIAIVGTKKDIEKQLGECVRIAVQFRHPVGRKGQALGRNLLAAARIHRRHAARVEVQRSFLWVIMDERAEQQALLQAIDRPLRRSLQMRCTHQRQPRVPVRPLRHVAPPDLMRCQPPNALTPAADMSRTLTWR